MEKKRKKRRRRQFDFFTTSSTSTRKTKKNLFSFFFKTKQQDVDTRRAKVSKYLRDPAFKKEIDEERRERLKKEAAAEPQRTGFRIIVPVNPIGIPEYETERFDLRLPYVDNGWVDEDADFFKQIGRFFGGGKKKEEGGEGKKGGKK